MADKERIYRIKFEGLESQVTNLANLKKSVDDLKAAKKALDLSTEEGRKTDEKLTLEIKNLNKQYQEQQKEVEKMDKLNQTQGTTLEKMRAKLSLMRKELEGMQVGSKAFNDQTKAVEQLQNKINSADEATGKFNGSVGNYKNKIIDAFAQMGISVTAVTDAVNVTRGAIVSMETATTKGAAAMKVLKIALASTGIGALIVAVGSLVAYFASTQEGIDKINKVLEPMKTIFQRIVGIIQEFGKGLAMIFSGDFKGGMEQLGATISNVGTNLKDAANDGSRLAQITIEIEKARIKLAENEARIRREIAEQRTILSDTGKSEKERIAAGEKYKTLRTELLELDKGIAKLEYEQALIKSEQNDTDREAQEDLARKKEAVNALEATALMEQKEAQTQISGLIKASTTARLKAAEDEKKAQEELAKYTIGLLKEADVIMSQTITKIDKAITDFEEKRKAAEESFNEFNENFEKPQEQEIQDEEELTLVLLDIKKKRADLEMQLQENSWQLTKDGIRDLVDYKVLTEREGEKLIIENKMASYQLTAQMAGQAATLFKKNTVAYKALAISEAVINTVLGMIRALKDFPAPLSYVMMALTGAMGTAATMKIANVKLAKGGIVGGQLHEQGGTVYRGSDGQSFEAERGELIAVVNRHDTERLKALSAANSVHGRPFFAAGGMIQPNTQFLNQDLGRVMAETVSQIASIPVVVSERDITRSQRRVSIIENSGNL